MDVLDEVDSVPAPKHPVIVVHPLQHNIQLLLSEGLVLLLLGNIFPDVAYLSLSLIFLLGQIPEMIYEMLVSRRRYLNLRLEAGICFFFAVSLWIRISLDPHSSGCPGFGSVL